MQHSSKYAHGGGGAQDARDAQDASGQYRVISYIIRLKCHNPAGDCCWEGEPKAQISFEWPTKQT